MRRSDDLSVPVPPIDGVDCVVACWSHEGDAADLVRQLKYRRGTAAVSALADTMAQLAPAADLVTWVPATPSRRRERGFDQAELLARAVARRLGRRPRRLLRRLDDRAQTAKDRDGRLGGPELVARRRSSVPGKAVLVIDDVCTTGATLEAAGRCLRAVGAARVVAVVSTAVGPVPRAQSG